MASDKSYALERRLNLLNLAVDSAGILRYTSAVDGNVYTVGTCIQQITGSNHNKVISSTSPVDVSGGDIAFGVGAKRYNLEGLIVASSGSAAGTRNYRITGPGVSEVELFVRFDQVNTATLVSGQTHTTYQAAGTTSATGYNAGFITSVAMNNNGQVFADEFRCSFTFTGSGTLQLLAAEGTGGDPWTVNYGYLQLTAT